MRLWSLNKVNSLRFLISSAVLTSNVSFPKLPIKIFFILLAMRYAPAMDYLRWIRPEGLPGMRKILKEFRPYRGRVILVVVLGLVISAIQPVAVKLVNRIVDELQKGSKMDPS